MPAQKRAYTDEEKLLREEKIIESAQILLDKKGFSNLNMAEVAEEANLAKGTVYRYFNTKEELFLSVFELKIRAWLTDLINVLENEDSPMPAESLINILVNSIDNDPQLTKLIALKHILLEHNISFERAYDNIVWMQNATRELGELIADKLTLQRQQGIQICKWAFVFIIGLEGMAHPAPTIKQVYESEQTLQAMEFKSELRGFLLTVIRGLQL